MKEKLLRQSKIEASLLLLAGGRGVRMGGKKLYLEIDGKLLIEQTLRIVAPIFKETILLVSQGEKKQLSDKLRAILDKHSVVIVEDEKKAVGPLEGLRIGLESMTQQWGFLMGCDMPTVQENIVRFMSTYCTEETDLVAAEREGYIEPLHAFYSKKCLEAIQKSLKNKNHKMKFFYRDIKLILLKEELLQTQGDIKKSFLNLNYPEDLVQIRKLAR